MGHRVAVIGKNRKMVSSVGSRFKNGHGYRRLSMNAYLNRMVRQLYGIQEAKQMGFELKQQLYDAWYKIDPEIWIQRIKRIVEACEPTTNIIVPDVRYMNELQILKELDFTLVRVTSVPSTALSIVGLGMNTNPGAILYYEHFSPQSIQCKYSVHVDSYGDAVKATQSIINNLD